MTNTEFEDAVAIAALQSFLRALPIPGLPNPPQNPNERIEFAKHLARDAWLLAHAMLRERQAPSEMIPF